MRFFKNNILDFFDVTRNNPHRSQQFYQIIFDTFDSQLFNIVEMSCKRGLIKKIIYFLLNNRPRFETNFPTMKGDTLIPILIEILVMMVLATLTKGIYNLRKFSPYSTFQNNMTIDMPDEEWQMLMDREVLIATIMRRYHSEGLVKMLHHIGWGDEQISLRIIQESTIIIKE
jgi:hypothetical protein